MTDQTVKHQERPRFRRRRSVIRPSLQLKVSAIFVSLLAVMLILFATQLHNATRGMVAVDSDDFHAALSEIIYSKLLSSLALGAALTIAVAMIVTFRIAGPVFRMRSFLARVRDGEQTEPCRLRKGDAFQDLCDAINEVTEAQRAHADQPVLHEEPVPHAETVPEVVLPHAG